MVNFSTSFGKMEAFLKWFNTAPVSMTQNGKCRCHLLIQLSNCFFSQSCHILNQWKSWHGTDIRLIMMYRGKQYRVVTIRNQVMTVGSRVWICCAFERLYMLFQNNNNTQLLVFNTKNLKVQHNTEHPSNIWYFHFCIDCCLLSHSIS